MPAICARVYNMRCVNAITVAHGSRRLAGTYGMHLCRRPVIAYFHKLHSRTAQQVKASAGAVDFRARRNARVAAEIAESAKRSGLKGSLEDIQAGLSALQALLPGFEPNLDAMRPAEWAKLALDAEGVGAKIIMLKLHYPRLDLAKVLAKKPKMLLLSYEKLDQQAQQVRHLLSRAKDLERLLGLVPELLDPKECISILITVTKWYHLEKDPIEVLEDDPELVQRAQDNDTPFEPVYMDENGQWMAPLLNYAEKRTQWQAYIDQTFYKQP